MKVTLQREALLRALQIINGVIEKKQTRPVLANTLLRVVNERLSLTATDTEIELIGEAHLDQVVQAGAVTAPARKLYDICRALPENTALTLLLDGERLILQSSASRFTLATLPAQDFPSIEENSLAGQFTISCELPQSDLRQLLYKTSFAMGEQDVRHYLNSTIFDISPGQIECMATDGHRFALSRIQDAAIPQVKTKVLLPRKSVLELMRLLSADEQAPLTLAVNDHYLRIITPNFSFTSKLIHAALPDYHKLIPQKGEHVVLAQRETVRQALVRVSILSHEKFRSIRWELKPGQLQMSANNPEREEAEEIVPVEYQGRSVEVSFNVMYLLDVLSVLDTDNIRWSFSNMDEGILIEPADNSASSLYVVMPLLVSQAEVVNA